MKGNTAEQQIIFHILASNILEKWEISDELLMQCDLR